MASTNRKIRVLHIITRLIVGGAQENTIYTCHLLDPGRYEVDLVIGPQLGPEGELVSIVEQDRIGLTTLDPLVREINPLKDLRALGALRGHIRNGRYDVVHTHSSKAGILGRIAARQAGVPVIVHTVHGWGFHDRMNPLKKRAYVLAEKICERMTDKMIVVTRLDSDAGLEYGIGRADKYMRIFSAIDLDEFMNVEIDVRAKKLGLGLDPDLPVVGCVGRLSPQKAPEYFVRMAAEVVRAHAAVQFLYVGGGPLRQDMESLIRELGLDGKIVLTGLRRDVPELMRVMDVFVLLSLWEGLPRVFSQAMAAGLPVIASDVGGASEIVQDGDNGFLVPPGDFKTPAAKVLVLLGNDMLRKRMGERGRDRVYPDFDVKQMVRQIDDLYMELLTRKGVAL